MSPARVSPSRAASDLAAPPGAALRALMDVVARWALAALPGVDGVVVSVHRPAGVAAGTAGLADDVDPAYPYYQVGTRVERSLPLVHGDVVLGAITLYVCDLPDGAGPALDADTAWLADLVAVSAASMIVRTLLPPVPAQAPARADGAVPFGILTDVSAARE